MNKNVLFSSDKKNWETPQKFFNALNEEFHFTLDAAASHENHKCENYYTEEQDGLVQDWGGAYSVVQSSIWECRNRCADQKMLRRIQKTKYYCYVNGRPEYEKEAVNGETNRC